MNKKNDHFLVSVAVCLVSIQAVTVLSALLAPFAPGAGCAAQILPEWAAGVKPKWDLALFLVFITAALAGGALALRLRWQVSAGYCMAEAAMTFLLLSAAFKMTIYDNSPFLAQSCLMALAAAAVALKFFWRELCILLEKTAKQKPFFSTERMLIMAS